MKKKYYIKYYVSFYTFPWYNFVIKVPDVNAEKSMVTYHYLVMDDTFCTPIFMIV